MLQTQSYPKTIFSPTISNADHSAKDHKRSAPHIMILDSGRLLDDAIYALLGEEVDMQISVIHIDDEELIAQAIGLQNPDVVILCQSASFSVEKLSLILTDRKYSNPIQIMSVSICGNSLEIYDQKQLVSSNFRNFVNLIKNINFAPHSA